MRLNLAAPFAPLLAALTDRAGMIVSPKAAQAAGDHFGSIRCARGRSNSSSGSRRTASCSSGYPNYWNKGAVHLDQIVYLPIVDSTVRLANLISGQLDFVERLAASDVPGSRPTPGSSFRDTEIGYQGITINIGKSDLAQKNPLGRDPRVREAFELSLDRDAIVQVVMDGEADVGNQWVAPTNPLYARTPDPEARRRQGERSAAGGRRAQPAFTLMAPTTSDGQKSPRSCRRWPRRPAST